MSISYSRKSSSGHSHPLPDPLLIPATRQPLASHTHHMNTPTSGPSTPTIPTHHSSPTSLKRQVPGPSRAEAYASAHQPRRSKEAINITEKEKEKGKHKAIGRERETSNEGRERNAHGGSGGGSKPIFDWISRKLGAGRRASIAEPNSNGAIAGPSHSRGGSTARIVTADGRTSKYTSLPKKRTGGMEPIPPVPSLPISTPQPNRTSRAHQSKFQASEHVTRLSIPQATNLRPRLSPTNIFPQTPGRDSILSRSESHSLQSYPLYSATPSERERRREANNPYPSMPIQMYKGSIMSSNASAWASASGLGERSVSFRTRSRTPSIRSVSSSLRPRISIAGDVESMRSTRYGRDVSLLDDRQDERNLRTPMEADDNASMRPLPPSHPPSPTPSYTMLSRSASGSLLSPRPNRSRSLASPRRPQSVGFYSSSSVGNSISEGYGDGDSRGTRYYPNRRDSASTKPTTVISFDSGPGVAHIAQVIPAPVTTVTQPIVNAIAGPSTQGMATPSMTARSTPISGSPISTTLASSPLRTSFSQDVPFPLRQSAVTNSPASSHISAPTPPSPISFQAQPPKHSHPHPIHNPRPSSPPNDNASIMTLASSTFAAPYPAYAAGGPGSIHRPTSIISDRAASSPATPVLGNGMLHNQQTGTRTMGTSPSVTFAPIHTSDSPVPSTNYPTRPSSLAQSHLSVERDQEIIRRPPSLASPVDKEYPPSLHPTLGTRGSASLSHASWGYPGRQAGVDDRASTTAVRRRGSGSSMGSLESRWSWRGNTAGAGVPPTLGKRAYDGPEAIAEGVKG